MDDVRSFRDGRDCVIARTAEAGLQALRAAGRGGFDEIWLDHDLGQSANGFALTVRPVIEELVAAASRGRPFPLGEVIIHTSNVRAGHEMCETLRSAGYRVRRVFNWHDFVNRRTEAEA